MTCLARGKGMCVGGVGLLDGEIETHTDMMTLEGRHAQEYFVPAGRKSGNVPPGMQQSK